MFQVFPFLPWLALATSAALLMLLWASGEVGRRGLVLFGWFVIAGYCQFFGGSDAVTVVGLVMQTFLAIVLLIRWKLAA